MKGNCISSWNKGRDVKTKSTCKLFFFQKSLPPPKRFYGGSTHSAAKRTTQFKLVNENLKPPPKKIVGHILWATHIRWIRILKTYNMVLWWENVCANCKWISCQRATRLPRINEIVMFTVHEPKPLEHIHRSIWHQDIGRIGCYEFLDKQMQFRMRIKHIYMLKINPSCRCTVGLYSRDRRWLTVSSNSYMSIFFLPGDWIDLILWLLATL